MAAHNPNENIKIMQINANSLISSVRRHNMQTFLKTHKPCAVLISETVLQPKHKIVFDNYQFIRTDKDNSTHKRGTGILIKNNIKYSPINTITWNLKTLEATAIIIETVDNKKFFIVSVYRSAKNRGCLDVKDLEIIIEKQRKVNRSKLIVGGDLNALHEIWLNIRRCPSGIALARWLDTNSALLDIKLLHSAEPTYYKGNYSSYLDVFIVSEDIDVVFPTATPNELTICDYPSDHRAVELIVSTSSVLSKAPDVQVQVLQKTNWKVFNNIIDAGINNVKVKNNENMTTQEIDIAVQDLTELITTTMDAVIPKVTIKRSSDVIIPDSLLHIIEEKNRLRRRWQRRRYNHDEHALKSEIKCLEKIIKDQLRIVHTQHWQKKLSSVKLDRHTFANIRKFTKSAESSTVHMLNRNDVTQTSTTNDAEKAEILGKHYEAVHHQNENIGDPDFTTTVERYVEETFREQPSVRSVFSQHATANPSFVFDKTRHLVSINSLNDTLSSRANKKSKGEDKISNFVIKKLSPKFRILLAMLFNQAYNIGYFPAAWKRAIIVPILKKSKPSNEAASYRPISLLSCLGKTFEHCVNKVVAEECSRLMVIPNDQFGLSFGRSVYHPLTKFTTDVTMEINKRTPTIACTLDIEKAYDTVWINGLIYKMHNLFGFEAHLCSFILNYLSDRSFQVIVNNKLSASHQIVAGVPQGGVLSAFLYIIFVSDLPAPPVSTNPVRRLQFADDILVYIAAKQLQTGQDRLNNYINTIEEHLTKWRIKINPLKAEAVVFKGTNKQHGVHVNKNYKNIKIVVNGQQVNLKNQLKYLGVIYSQRPTFAAHVTEALAKAGRAYHNIKGVLKSTSKLDTQIKLLCYKQLIRPILSFGFPAWAGISSCQMERLRCFERRCIRACINYKRPYYTYKWISNKELYQQSEIKRIDCFMLDSTIKLFGKWPQLETLDDCINLDADQLDDVHQAYKPPWYIQHLHDTNRLYVNSAPSIYHVRHRANTRHLGPVYSMSA